MPYRVTGQTFPHRDLLKGWRGVWNSSPPGWEFRSLSAAQIGQLRGTVGLTVAEIPDAEPSLGDDNLVEILRVIRGVVDRDKPTASIIRDGATAVYGDDPRYLNHFADQNPTAFFGFSSLAAFVDYVAALDRPPSGRDDGWERSNPGGWYGTANIGEALRLAREGWLEGVQDADALDIPHAQRRKRRHAVAGGSVNVGRLLAGNPAHMIHRPKQPGRRVVTLFVETFMSAGIDPDNAIARAILIGRIADVMEREGYSAEIVAVLTTLGQSGDVGHQAAITIKQAGERLSLIDCVFALGHPSFFRRLCFGAVGAARECRSTWSSQGYPTAAFKPDHPCGRNEFYIKQLSIADQLELGDDPLDMLRFIEPDGLPVTLRS